MVVGGVTQVAAVVADVELVAVAVVAVMDVIAVNECELKILEIIN